MEEEARFSFVKENPFGDFTVPLVALLRGKRIDLSATKDYELDYHEVPGPLKIMISRLPFMRKLQVPGIVSLMMKATVVASAVHSKSVRSQATLLLNPPVGRFGLLAMGDFEEIVEVGYQHACEALKDWSPQTTDTVPTD